MGSLWGSGHAHAAGHARGGVLPWRWSGAPDPYPWVVLSARLRHQAWVLRELPSGAKPDSPQLHRAELRTELRKGGVRRVVWRRTLRARLIRRPGGATLIEARRR